MNTDRGCTARASDDRYGRTRPTAPRSSVAEKSCAGTDEGRERIFSHGPTPCPVRIGPRRRGGTAVGWVAGSRPAMTDKGQCLPLRPPRRCPLCAARASDDRHERTRSIAPRPSVFICAHPWLKIPGPAQVKGAGGFFLHGTTPCPVRRGGGEVAAPPSGGWPGHARP